MSYATLTRPRSTTPSRLERRSHGARPRPARRPSPQLIADGVVAGYIHEISVRGRGTAPAPRIVSRSANDMSEAIPT
jgi:hypothetical protein